MERPKFVIEAPEAESLARASDLSSAADVLPSLVKAAQALARPPISKFHVGAVGYGSASGRIFTGVNVEFPGLPLHHSIHAEQFLVANLALHREPRLHSLAVSAAPCGHCRQFLQELRRAHDLQILIADGSEPSRFEPLLSLLPRRFGPDDLLDKDIPLLLETHDNGLIFPNGGAVDALKAAALDAVNAAHAPYSACPSGVAIADRAGRVYKGSYMESAAYNPSLGPVQAAIVAYIVGKWGRGGGDGDGYEGIAAAVLVEKEGAVIRQEETARLLLRTIAPECEFKVFHCVPMKKKTCSSFGDFISQCG